MLDFKGNRKTNHKRYVPRIRGPEDQISQKCSQNQGRVGMRKHACRLPVTCPDLERQLSVNSSCWDYQDQSKTTLMPGYAAVGIH